MAIFGVSPNGERWQVTREGEIVSLHLSRDEAMDAARDAAQANDGRVWVVDEHAETTGVMVAGSGEPEGHQGATHPQPNEGR